MNHNEIKGYQQLKAIMNEILDSGEHFDFLNNVLDCKAILGDFKLWYWWGELRIVENSEQKKAGDMKVLEDWNTEKDGTITLMGVNK